MPTDKPIIIQMFNKHVKVIANDLLAIASKGFTHIQISPITVNVNAEPWFYRYQSICFAIGNKYIGNYHEIRDFIQAAKALGIYVIVDVVLNHVCALNLNAPDMVEFNKFIQSNPQVNINDVTNYLYPNMNGAYIDKLYVTGDSTQDLPNFQDVLKFKQSYNVDFSPS